MTDHEDTPERIRQRARDILRRDAALDDDIYTPPAAIGLDVPPAGEGPETAGDREPRDPIIPSSAGAVALESETNEVDNQEPQIVTRAIGQPVTRSAPRPDRVPGAQLSPEASARLRQELHEINVAEMAVRGSDVIVYPNP